MPILPGCARLAFPLLALAAITAPAAGAATISGGATITVTSGPEAEDFYVYEDVDANRLIFETNSSAAAPLTAGGSCQQNGSAVSCPRQDIVANLGAGDDKVDFSGIGTSKVDARGGSGNDALSGGPSADKLYGNEDVDYIDGRNGADMLDGGDDHDTFEKLSPSEDVAGGGGEDYIQFYGAPAGVYISLDDVANDGTEGARTANVHSDVEGVAGSPFDDHLTGNVMYNDLAGGDGADEIVGGGGTVGDRLRGDRGNDRLDAVNEAADDLGCGEGTDSIRIDPRDRTDDCETVDVVGPDNDGDGSKPPVDCDDNNAAVRPGGTDVPGNGVDEDCSGADAPLLDADQDGSVDTADCDDANPAIKPGAPDRPGDGIDQDCDGADDPYPVVVGTLTMFFRESDGRVRITLLRISGAQAGARARVRCRGRGCPFRRRNVRLSRGRATATRLFRGARLGRGAVVELRLSASDAVTRIRRLTVLRSGKVRLASLCLKPGESRPTPC